MISRCRMSALLALSLSIAVTTPTAYAGRPSGGGGTGKTTSFAAINLGVLPGGTWSSAAAVSESGSVVGTSVADQYSATYWYSPNGQEWHVYALPSGLSGNSNSHAAGIAGPVEGQEYVAGSIDGAAVLWTVNGHTSFSGPVSVASENCGFSTANAVNQRRDLAGMCDYQAAIWIADSNGYSEVVLNTLSGAYAEVLDINDAGVVVGRHCEDIANDHCEAFLRMVDGTLVDLIDTINDDPYSYAAAVSDVVTNGGTGPEFVYVTGATMNEQGVQRGMRWTVPLSSSPVEIIQTPLIKQWCSGVNDAGQAICTSSGRARQSTGLWRDGAVSDLKPPKGATGAASFDLARKKDLPSYAVGVANIDGGRAVIWVINK